MVLTVRPRPQKLGRLPARQPVTRQELADEIRRDLEACDAYSEQHGSFADLVCDRRQFDRGVEQLHVVRGCLVLDGHPSARHRLHLHRERRQHRVEQRTTSSGELPASPGIALRTRSVSGRFRRFMYVDSP